MNREELELSVVYNANGTVRCIYLDDHRIYGGKPYVSEGLKHDHFKVKTADIEDVAKRNGATLEKERMVVLGWDKYEDIAHREMDKLINGTNPLRGKRGQLILREDKGEPK